MGLGSSFGIAAETGNNIVTDGLVFYVDAAYKKSYPGDGSTWTDIINNSAGTITNATFNSNGYFDFDGSGDRIDFSAHDNFNFGDGDFTIAIWWRYTGSNFNGYPYLLDMRGSGNVIVIYPFTSNRIEVYTNGNQWNTGSETLTVNNWFHVVYCRVGTTRYLYVNNSLTNSQSSYTTTLVEGKVRIGARNNGNQVWTGNIPIVQLYKGKGFTSSDVSQNYNAQKERFGF